MAKFMDVHTGFIGVTAEQIEEAHGRDLAIEADEGVHFARTKVEGDPLEGADAGKRFGDGGRGQQHVWLGDCTAATIQPACRRRQDLGRRLQV